MDSDPAAPIADGVSRRLDPRWIAVQRIRNAIFLAVLMMPSFVAVIVLWIATRTLAAGLFLVPLWGAAIAALAWQLYRWPALSYQHEIGRASCRERV